MVSGGRGFRHRWGKAGILSAVLLAVLLLTAACGGKDAASAPPKAAGGEFLRVTDDTGRTVVLTRRPQRVAVLAPSLLELYYSAGGQAIARPTSKTADIPQAAASLPEVGMVYNINPEQLVALQPDLVIAMAGTHEKLVPVLESSHIPVLLLRLQNYDDVVAKTTLFGQLAGSADQAKTVLAGVDAKLKEIVGKLPSGSKKIAILHATPKTVTVELEGTVAGDAAKMLRLTNVAAGARPAGGAAMAPYSLEKLVESDPDLIFVVKMGPAADIEKRLREEVENSPAWAGLRAVREKKVLFLPSELFLLNPGLKTPDAVSYMAKLVYPEVYGDGKQ